MSNQKLCHLSQPTSWTMQGEQAIQKHPEFRRLSQGVDLVQGEGRIQGEMLLLVREPTRPPTHKQRTSGFQCFAGKSGKGSRNKNKTVLSGQTITCIRLSILRDYQRVAN